jgi:phenylacetate-CoA ligase
MRYLKFFYVFIQDAFVNVAASNLWTHRLLFAKHIEPYRWRLGYWRARRTYYHAMRKVPAYSRFVKANTKKLPSWNGWTLDLDAIPSMDKQNYIKKYSIEDRSYGGRLPTKGVVVDESSGSSGTPTSWVRGPYERMLIRIILQIVFAQQTSEKPKFVINAFALGAWATGMNVSASLTSISIIKSTGPDLDKIINTLHEFGTRYSYVILGYPPFLKNLADDKRIDLSKYDISVGFGGEGMSENMRRYLGKSFSSVTGSYGASDLEINIAVETEFTIKLRNAIEQNTELAKELIKTGYGVLPMIFQYNPYDYILETNEHGELLVTIARKENINPRIRYNIHDRGQVMRLKDLKPILKKYDLGHIAKNLRVDMPVLFHFGRSDLSIDYYGAIVTPDTVREVVYDDAELAQNFETYRLVSYEDKNANKQLHIAIEFKNGYKLPDAKAKALDVIAQMRTRNGDFNYVCTIAKDNTRPTIHFYEFGTGPFKADKTKLKHEYVVHLTAHQYEDYGLIVTPPVA